jgi:hypothetical protein
MFRTSPATAAPPANTPAAAQKLPAAEYCQASGRSLLQPFTSPHVHHGYDEKSQRARHKNDISHDICSSPSLECGSSLSLSPHRPTRRKAASVSAVRSVDQNFTSNANVNRFSIFRKSGDHNPTDGLHPPTGATLPSKHANDPGFPLFPPGPEKYGTLAARWLNSQRKVMYWLGIQSIVADASHAL